MSIERAKKQQAQDELNKATDQITALLNKPTAQIMVNPSGFRSDVGKVFAALVRAVWELTEVPDKTE